MKPFSEACERNQQPIFERIHPFLNKYKHVLEFGSGTGQHAVYFAERLPHLLWQTTDKNDALGGIQQWLDDACLTNTPKPMVLDIDDGLHTSNSFDVIFTANTLHIISEQQVEKFFHFAGQILANQGLLIIYGPFNYNGDYTSQSNARFDIWLKERDERSAIRDFERVEELAISQGFKLIQDYTMPANNRLLVWIKN